jgi:hypothetical protein
MPGAISRMQEIYKHSPTVVGWICTYLVAAGAQNRPVEEKEMVIVAHMMGEFAKANINPSAAQIQAIAGVTANHWANDFSPTSIFWADAGQAYRNWHNLHGSYSNPRFNKEPIHGYPYLMEQLKKDLKGQYKFPTSHTSSEFIPAAEDLK